MEDYRMNVDVPFSGAARPEADPAAGGMSSGIQAAAPPSAAQYTPRAGGQLKPTSTRPVFVVGCPRSGTTLLYHTILSSGDFAVFPLESDTFDVLGPRFSDLRSLTNRKRLLEFFLRTKKFAVTGLDRSDIEPRILKDCRNIGDFLRIVMEAMCRKQDAHRWAEKTPDHALYIPQIKRLIPDSLIVHIIRDGRDAALSLTSFGRIRPFFWEGRSKLLSFGVYWKWIVRKGRAAGRKIGRDYYELRYEDLVTKPRETLAQLGNFIGQDLDYDRILQVGVGSVSQPETSFPGQASAGGFNPVGRWKKQCSPEELARFEALVGDCLEETGYPLATSPERRRRRWSDALTAAFYTSQLESKLWLKSRTPLRRLVGTRGPF